MHSYIINTNDRDEKKIDAGWPLELVTSKEGELFIFCRQMNIFSLLICKIISTKSGSGPPTSKMFDKPQESILFQKRSLGRSLQNHDTWYF